ncbi:flavodoxin [Sphingobium sp.]|uniref:flavodoxin n=1 Tax=Sphingobium sp. TaxID=1912891 RepID=UPI002D06002F|nr:flavodoxin [Sphingobium sp.]HUD94691.1 flavodoxin [Sphingobium sp.]
MSEQDALSRRTLLATPALLAFAGTAACAQEGGARRAGAGRTLVAYLTRSGNTRVIAKTLQRELRADLFEIRTARPYPEDYEQHVAQATRERDGGIEPPLDARVEEIAKYEELFLGFPIWGETAPAPLRSFLRAHQLTGKTVRPFITHGGYGPGDATDVLASLAPGARIEKPFVLECDQERRTLDQIRSWLGQIEG